MKLRKRNQRNPEAGFSLIETMVAIIVLSISLIGLAQLVLVAQQQNRFAGYTTAGIGVAQAKLEELKSLYNSDIANGTMSTDMTPGSHGPETRTIAAPSNTNQGDQQFLVSWEIIDLGRGARAINLTVNPVVANPLQNKTITVNSQFAP